MRPGVGGALTPTFLPWSCPAHVRRQDGAMRTYGTSDGLEPLPSGRPASDCQGVAL